MLRSRKTKIEGYSRLKEARGMTKMNFASLILAFFIAS